MSAAAWASFCLRALVVAGLAVVFVCGLARGHPEDEFCIPGETALDPALCEALSALDIADPGGGLSPEARSVLADLEGRTALQTLALVFEFGLVHWLGFAGAFGELGLPQAQFWPGLLGFNIGVEIGHIGVAVLAMTGIWLAARATATTPRDHLRRIVRLAAAVISATGLFWTFDRVLGALASG